MPFTSTGLHPRLRRAVVARKDACGRMLVKRTSGGQGAGSFTGLGARLLGASPCRDDKHKKDDWQRKGVLRSVQYLERPSARPGARCFLAGSGGKANSPCPPSVPYWYVRRVCWQ